MTNAAKSGAEITKAHYTVKKKVEGKEIREIPTNQGLPEHQPRPEGGSATPSPLSSPISGPYSTVSAPWFAGLNNSLTRFNSTA